MHMWRLRQIPRSNAVNVVGSGNQGAVPEAVPLTVPAGGWEPFRWVFLQKGSLLR